MTCVLIVTFTSLLGLYQRKWTFHMWPEEGAMTRVLEDLLLVYCMAAFVTGIVIAAVTLIS